MPTEVAMIPEQRVQAGKPNLGFNENGLILVAAAFVLLTVVYRASSSLFRERTGFSITYVGLSILHQNAPAKLYDLKRQAAVRDSLFTYHKSLIFEHPPFEAFLLEPLAALPYKQAYLVWGVLSVLLWLAVPLILRPYASAPREPLGYFALWFLFPPLWIALLQGQPSILLLFIYSITFIALKRGQDSRAGVYLGLGLFKFQFVLPFVLIFLVRRKWRFLAGFFATASMLGILSLIAVGGEGVLSYIRLLFEIASHPNNLPLGKATGMATLKGFVQLILGHTGSPMLVDIVVAAVSMFLIVYTGEYWRQLDRSNPAGGSDLMFAAALVVALVTGFHMFSHDMSPLMIALLLLLAHFPGRDRPVLRLGLATMLVLLWLPPLYLWLISRYLMCLIFPILALVGLTVLHLAGRASEAAPNSYQLTEAVQHD